MASSGTSAGFLQPQTLPPSGVLSVLQVEPSSVWGRLGTKSHLPILTAGGNSRFCKRWCGEVGWARGLSIVAGGPPHGWDQWSVPTLPRTRKGILGILNSVTALSTLRPQMLNRSPVLPSSIWTDVPYLKPEKLISRP